MKCKIHTTYVGKQEPTKTIAHPDGCPTCWEIFDSQSLTNALSTVNIELTLEEARLFTVTLYSIINMGFDSSRHQPALKKLFELLHKAEQGNASNG